MTTPTTNQPAAELLPCPFCGKQSSGQEFGPGPYLSRSQNSLFKSVICVGCCSIASGETESKVIERWNTRHQPPAVPLGVIERERARDVVNHWREMYREISVFLRKHPMAMSDLCDRIAALTTTPAGIKETPIEEAALRLFHAFRRENYLDAAQLVAHLMEIYYSHDPSLMNDATIRLEVLAGMSDQEWPAIIGLGDER